MEGITREEAFELLKKYNQDPFHLQHAVTVEAVMGQSRKELYYYSSFFDGIILFELQLVVYMCMHIQD